MPDKEQRLRALPSVDRIVNGPDCAPLIETYGKEFVLNTARMLIEKARAEILAGGDAQPPSSDKEWLIAIENDLEENSKPKLRKAINCSGVVVHTNLGRAVLAEPAGLAAIKAALSNVNVEYSLESGVRGDRDDIVEGLITELTGAEAATVVNNNAAAVLLVLNTLSLGKETIVSRGELIEIGGSFRLPEIMERSGCVLKEVGATNKTHEADYTEAIGENTAMILRAHTSNYRIIGFTSQPTLRELSGLAKSNGLPMAVDLGSGTLIDLRKFGLEHEPTVQETLAEGADIVTISGDKLLGGPQSGIIVGKKELIDRIKKNHLKRALRCDKIILAALEATLRLYRDPEKAVQQIPTLRHLSRSRESVRKMAEKAAAVLKNELGETAEVFVIDDISRAGSGALPEIDLPSASVGVKSKSMNPNELAAWFRKLDPPVIGRVEDDLFRLDMRCVDSVDEISINAKS